MHSNDGEILGTLRFGERVKCIRNKPVINEITEDDVNDLSDQIRQLKVILRSFVLIIPKRIIKS